MSKLRQGFVLVATLMMGLVAASAHASVLANVTNPESGSAQPRTQGSLLTMRDGITLDEAVSRAERQYKARVVRAEVQDEDGRKVYVLKMYKSEDGLVFTVRIDAATGRMR
jgi:uncharacterized membrane protein YkoI